MAFNLFDERGAITRTLGLVAVLVVLVAAVAGGYLLTRGPSQPGPREISLTIVESDPVLQTDSFNPANVTATHGVNITLVVQNSDDEPRTFELSAFNVNQTISAGAAERFTFFVAQAGAFEMFVPATLANAATGLRASPSITGYLVAT